MGLIRMKFKFIFTAAVIVVMSSVMTGVYADSAQDIDGIAAEVNGSIITKSQLNQIVDRAKKQMEDQHTPIPDATKLRASILDGMINQKLQLQIAERSGIVVTDAEVEDAMKRVAAQNHLTVAELLQKASTTGFDPKGYRQAVKDQLTVNQVQMQALRSEVKVTPSDINQALKTFQHQMSDNKQYHVIDILFPSTKAADAEKALAALQNGSNVNQVGGEVSDLGLRPLAAFPDLFVAKVKAMKINSYSELITAPNGLHILALVEIQGQAMPAPTRQQAEAFVLQQKMQEAAKKWLATLRQTAYVKINP